MDEDRVMVMRQRQDWTSLFMGLFICGIGLLGVLRDRDLLGWVVNVKIWTNLTQSLAPALKGYAWLPGYLSLIATYVFFVLLMLLGVRIVGNDLKKFHKGFFIVFWASMACLVAGNYARIAATPDHYKDYGIGHSLGLTGEFGYVIALFVAFFLNLLVNNVKRFSKAAEDLKEAAQNGWYIQIALVIMGATLGVQAAGAIATTKMIVGRSFLAALGVFVIFWPMSYLISRKVFRFDRETSAVLASALSVCGVAAAQATNAVVKGSAKMLAMITAAVVLYCSLELTGLPLPVGNLLYNTPFVAGSFAAMAVKTDGAAIASGAITQAVVQAKMQSVTGTSYSGDPVLTAASMEKLWIDVQFFLFMIVLSFVWTYRASKTSGKKVEVGVMWTLFPKFALGYALMFLLALFLSLHSPAMLRLMKLWAAECNAFRLILFTMTFFSIGLIVPVKKFFQEGFGRVNLAYVTMIVILIIPIALGVSWLAFHGVMPPMAK